MSGRRATLIAVAIAYAALLASTTPFTTEADVVTAVALVAGTVVVALGLARSRSVPVAPAVVGDSVEHGSALAWLVLLAVVTGWELYSFFGGPRPLHPTLSTLYDLASRWPVAKAAIVLVWLGLGWELLR